MPGPPANPNARRRNQRMVLVLPADGRKGPVPEWPLSGATPAERKVWADLWATPQAVMWEQFGWTRTVARYCRTVVRAEQPNPTRDALAISGQLEGQLGLTPKAMKDLWWTVSQDELAEARAARPGPVERRRFRAVDPSSAAG